jgi:hypothetical protein
LLFSPRPAPAGSFCPSAIRRTHEHLRRFAQRRPGHRELPLPEEDGIDPESKKGQRIDRDGDGKPDTLDDISLTDLGVKLSRLTRDYPTLNIVDTMNADLELLQTGFMESLEQKLQKAGVNVTEAVTLKTDANGDVRVNGSHPDKEAIEAAINNDEQLKEAFAKITEQAGLISKVQTNSRYMSMRKGLDAYLQNSEQSGFDGMFMVNLAEGDMRLGLAGCSRRTEAPGRQFARFPRTRTSRWAIMHPGRRLVIGHPDATLAPGRPCPSRPGSWLLALALSLALWPAPPLGADHPVEPDAAWN